MTEIPIIKILLSKSVDWFLYDRDLRHESVKLTGKRKSTGKRRSSRSKMLFKIDVD